VFKFTIVPERFFAPEKASEILSEVVAVDEPSSVKNIELPQYKAVLIYSGEDASAAALSDMVCKASEIGDYNKIVVDCCDRELYVVVAVGDKLLLCNRFDAPDKVTALYFIFAALKQFQINPEISVLHTCRISDASLRSDLFRYFKSVESL